MCVDCSSLDEWYVFLLGISTPAIYFVDLENNCIYMEHVSPGVTVREHIQTVQQEHDGGDGQATMSLAPLAKAIGTTVGRLHLAGIIHGDLTTSNMLLRPLAADRHATRSAFDTPGGRTELVMLDFGLGQGDASAEDMGVDLYVLERAFVSTHPNTEALFDVLLESYRATCGKDAAEVMRKLDEIRLRGRKRTMVGWRVGGAKGRWSDDASGAQEDDGRMTRRGRKRMMVGWRVGGARGRWSDDASGAQEDDGRMTCRGRKRTMVGWRVGGARGWWSDDASGAQEDDGRMTRRGRKRTMVGWRVGGARGRWSDDASGDIWGDTWHVTRQLTGRMPQQVTCQVADTSRITQQAMW